MPSSKASTSAAVPESLAAEMRRLDQQSSDLISEYYGALRSAS